MEHIKALAAQTLASLARPAPKTPTVDPDEELVDKLVGVLLAKLAKHVSDPTRVQESFWAQPYLPDDITHEIVYKVRERLIGLGFRVKWVIGACGCGKGSWDCYCDEIATKVYIKPTWCGPRPRKNRVMNNGEWAFPVKVDD
jgi:hypothetical protein